MERKNAVVGPFLVFVRKRTRKPGVAYPSWNNTLFWMGYFCSHLKRWLAGIQSHFSMLDVLQFHLGCNGTRSRSKTQWHTCWKLCSVFKCWLKHETLKLMLNLCFWMETLDVHVLSCLLYFLICSWNHHISISKLHCNAGHKRNDPFCTRSGHGRHWCKHVIHCTTFSLTCIFCYSLLV
jgi:SNF family Na+-dependent transporter